MPKALRQFIAPVLAVVGSIVLPGIGAAIGAKLGALIGGGLKALGAAKLAAGAGHATALAIGGKAGVAKLAASAAGRSLGVKTLASAAAAKGSVGWATLSGGISPPSLTSFTTSAMQSGLLADSKLAPYVGIATAGIHGFQNGGAWGQTGPGLAGAAASAGTAALSLAGGAWGTASDIVGGGLGFSLGPGVSVGFSVPGAMAHRQQALRTRRLHQQRQAEARRQAKETRPAATQQSQPNRVPRAVMPPYAVAGNFDQYNTGISRDGHSYNPAAQGPSPTAAAAVAANTGDGFVGPMRPRPWQLAALESDNGSSLPDTITTGTARQIIETGGFKIDLLSEGGQNGQHPLSTALIVPQEDGRYVAYELVAYNKNTSGHGGINRAWKYVRRGDAFTVGQDRTHASLFDLARNQVFDLHQINVIEPQQNAERIREGVLIRTGGGVQFVGGLALTMTGTPFGIAVGADQMLAGTQTLATTAPARSYVGKAAYAVGGENLELAAELTVGGVAGLPKGALKQSAKVAANRTARAATQVRNATAEALDEAGTALRGPQLVPDDGVVPQSGGGAAALTGRSLPDKIPMAAMSRKEAGRVGAGATAGVADDGVRATAPIDANTSTPPAGKTPSGANYTDELVGEVGDQAKRWLGQDYRVITNRAGDRIFVSKDGLRKIRFDINNSHGDLPHIHMEAFRNGKWRDAIPDNHRLYPSGEAQ